MNNVHTLLNLTPHPITLRSEDGEDTVLAPSGTVARVSSTPGSLTRVAGLPVPVATPDGVGEVTGLPAPSEGTVLLVSGFVGAAVKGLRDDVLVPGTGPADGAVRNEKGHIVAVTRLKVP